MEDYFPENENQPIDEEEEIARAEEKERRERRSVGFYYRGILQGLLLGIGGNLLVAYLMEVLRGIVSAKYWFVTNLAGFIVGLFLVLWVSWSLFIQAGRSIYGSRYEELLKTRTKMKINLLWHRLKYLLKHGRLPRGSPA